MLTEHEEKLIQRYYIYPKIAITAVIMALALGVPFILLEMIDDLVFHDEEVIFWGLYVYLGFAALYLILFCYCTLRAKLGMRKDRSCSAVSRSVSSSPIIPQLPRAPWPWGLPAA